MPRPLRIQYPNAWYHVMNRGAGRKKIFKTNSHRIIFLELLAECHKMFNVKIFAYCLMDNHYHLLLSTPDANLPRVMRHINGIYTQRYNRLMNTDGALFRGRYKAQLIEDDSYQLMVTRYIHLNPVEANLVVDASQYKWSSYQAYLGITKKPEWLITDIILDQISEIKSVYKFKKYHDCIEEKDINLMDSFISARFTAPILGSEIFKKKIVSNVDAKIANACAADLKRATSIPKIETIIASVCEFYNIENKSLMRSMRGKLNWPRLVCIYLCRKYFGHTLGMIAQSFNCGCTATISTSVYKCGCHLEQWPSLFEELREIQEIVRVKVLHGSGEY